jgi:beta-galactosidase
MAGSMTRSSTSFQASRRLFLLGSACAATFALAPTLPAFAAVVPTLSIGRQQPFDLGWSFLKGDGQGFETTDFDDKSWRRVDLPHDWSIEDLPAPAAAGGKPTLIGPFDKKALNGVATGFTEGGTGWYRKRFRTQLPTGGRAEITFDGVYMNSEVWINGHRLGAHPNGYTEFTYDLTPHLRSDGDNVLAVRVRNEGKNSRWYSGSGIYRHVWLNIFAEPSRIARFGTSVVTRQAEGAHAAVDVTTTLSDMAPGLTLTTRIKDPKGKTVWEHSDSATETVSASAALASVKLWSPDTPELYVLETELKRGQVVLDRTHTPFGIRIVTFSAETGMAINGQVMKLRGGCIHHDNGLMGAACFDDAEERKVRLLKARGFNAVRPSHNPFSHAFLDACDRLGMLVIAETFDAWQSPKVPDDYSVYFADHWASDVTTIIRGQRHHPSIIMWSIGNEIPDRNLPAGVENQWRLTKLAHDLDPYRPVTAAINDFAGREVVASDATARPGHAGVPDQTSFLFLDVAGYNYKYGTYGADHKIYPSRPMYGSESFPKDLFAIWDLTEKAPFVLGDFVWTAMDYLGEAGIGGSVLVAQKYAQYGATPSAWPMVNAFCGDLDLIGNQKTQSLARDVVWGLSRLEVAVQRPLPEGKVEILRPWGWSDERASWTWPGAEGKPLAVRIFTLGNRVDVVLNGQLVETLSVTPSDQKHVEVKVPYTPGTLEVIAYADKTVVARKSLVTAGAAAKVSVTPERRQGGAGRDRISFVQISLQDKDGRHPGEVDLELTAKITGPAEVIGFGSGNPNAVQGFLSTNARTYNGQALLILRGTGKPGTVSIEVAGKDLMAGIVVIQMA